MKSGMMMITLVVVVVLVVAGFVAGDSVESDCANEFPKVTACLTFATGKADTPTGECCKTVTDLKNRKPVCLCYIIQQIHDGSSPQIKSMGIQEARLLQLPSACKLTNASSTECPKLLGLSPNSPDAAIFTNNSTASAAPSSSSSPTKTDNNAASSAYGPKGTPPPALLAMLVFFFFALSTREC